MLLENIATARALLTHSQLTLPDGTEIGFEHTASVDVDPQNGFTPLCPTELPVSGGDEIVDELNADAGLTSRRYAGGDFHPEGSLWLTTQPSQIATPIDKNALNEKFPHVDLSDIDVYWPAHCMAGTFGAELLVGLPRPDEYDFFARKGTTAFRHGYSDCLDGLMTDAEFLAAFEKWNSSGRQGHFHPFSTGMIEDMLLNGVLLVVTGGLATDFCVAATERHLLLAGFYVIHNEAASRGIFGFSQDEAEIAMKKQAHFDAMRALPNGNRYFVVNNAEEIRTLYR